MILAGTLAPWATRSARAEDVGAVMAAFKDEKAECRYLKALRERITAAGNDPDPVVATRGMERALDDVGVVLSVMRAKHDKMPACAERRGKIGASGSN